MIFFALTTALSLFVSILSIFGMAFYLKDEKIFTLTQINFNPLLLYEYKKHTKEKYGKIGRLYYLFIATFIATFILGLITVIFVIIGGPIESK